MVAEQPDTAAAPRSIGLDVDRVNLRMAASRLYRELRWVGIDHIAAKAEVTRQIEDVCRG